MNSLLSLKSVRVFAALALTAAVACGSSETPSDTSADGGPPIADGGPGTDTGAGQGGDGAVTDSGGPGAEGGAEGGADTGAPVPLTSGSCSTIAVVGSNEGLCQDWGSASPVTNWPDNCAALSGTFSASACPTASRVGTCTKTNTGLLSSWIFRLYSPKWTAGTAQNWCNTVGGGTFTAN